MKQIPFSALSNDPLFKTQLAFGGTLMKKAKFRTYRPLDRKRPLHMVLRSSQAKGHWNFRTSRNFKAIEEALKLCSRKYGVKVAQFSNNGNHLHLLIWITNRPLYNGFIRSFSGMVAQRIVGFTKQKLDKKFWDYRPFTRIVMGWKGYQIARDYVLLNKLEALGILGYQPQRLRTVHRPLLV